MTITKKTLGCDFELANAMTTPGLSLGQSVYEASRRLLDEITGYPLVRGWAGTVIEWGRRYLAGNGGSAYIDQDHLEMNTPEHTRAADHALHLHAGYRLAQRAMAAANAKLPARSGKISLLANVSDRIKSWGAHLNVCVSRRLWDDIFTRKPHLAGIFATHLATSTPYTGAGQVGAGNGRARCDFQLSQRADFFEEFVGWQTTHKRPILNARDESHTGNTLARMHVIYFDGNLAPTAAYLKAGTTQLVLAMMEAGWLDAAMMLDDPVEAAATVSRDMGFKAHLRLVGRGKVASAIDVQRHLCEQAGEFVASGECGDAVPGAEDIVVAWASTLEMVSKRDFAALSRRTDWALKYLILDRQRGRRNLSWDSADMQALDLRYASLDPAEGLFLQLAAAGSVDGMPTSAEIDAAVDEPPTDSRAYLRAHLMRRLGGEIGEMDWDRVKFRQSAGKWRASGLWLGLNDPARYGKDEADPILESCERPEEFIDAIGEPEWPERAKTTFVSLSGTTGGSATDWGRRSWSGSDTAW